MISLDTNLLIYARVESNPWHQPARKFLEQLAANPAVMISELVLVEFYLALRNPAIMDPPLDAASAVTECQWFRAHPHWALVEQAEVMAAVWQDAAAVDFPRRRIIDTRLARTLVAHGVTEFATVNVKDFQGFGFARVWNPLAA